MIFSIHATGLGGQGVLTLTRLLAEYTRSRGFRTTIFNSKGMAQRGGRVTSDIRICDQQDREFDPRIAGGGADILLAMEVGEALNSKGLIRSDGTVLLYGRRIIPTAVVMDRNGRYPELDEVRDHFQALAGRVHLVPAVDEGANIHMLGVLAAALPSAGAFFEAEPGQLEEILRSRLTRNSDANIAALRGGYEYGRKIAH
ncbi:MAG: 2-oxoacid:acceptor oxidoreductase family protein [Spirochaetota bacterium]|nr:2-oxoacid:acceptor oxidoreductase family protein [Spirochaetota bacterium]